eukprot:TRINITY_DN789_c0_g2_i2.p1 TRINITY_DN789_c0_g2~~TRINITY_DN789_c0_g2_i2.p1  ORF type:complete len:553 (-),score=87.25 TRINITY_DN789_c0_g2_i2:5-1663(-)
MLRSTSRLASTLGDLNASFLKIKKSAASVERLAEDIFAGKDIPLPSGGFVADTPATNFWRSAVSSRNLKGIEDETRLSLVTDGILQQKGKIIRSSSLTWNEFTSQNFGGSVVVEGELKVPTHSKLYNANTSPQWVGNPTALANSLKLVDEVEKNKDNVPHELLVDLFLHAKSTLGTNAGLKAMHVASVLSPARDQMEQTAINEHWGSYFLDEDIFVHDGALGSSPEHEVLVRIITPDAKAALFLKHMVGTTKEKGPKDFTSRKHYKVIHIPNYVPDELHIQETFMGGRGDARERNYTKPGATEFIQFDDINGIVIVAGPIPLLQQALVSMAGLEGFRGAYVPGDLASGFKQQVTLRADSTVGPDGQATLYFHDKPTVVDSPTLFGAHHHVWSNHGIARLWAGISTSHTPQFALKAELFDLVLRSQSGVVHTRTLPIALGLHGTRPRGLNNNQLDRNINGRVIPTLEAVASLRPLKLNPTGVNLVFIDGGKEGPVSLDEAADIVASSHVKFPLGYADAALIRGAFFDLAKASNASAKRVNSTPLLDTAAPKLW